MLYVRQEVLPLEELLIALEAALGLEGVRMLCLRQEVRSAQRLGRTHADAHGANATQVQDMR